MFVYFKSVGFRDPLAEKLFLLIKRKVSKLGGINNLVGLKSVINRFFFLTKI